MSNLKPLLKYPGGKGRELNIISKNLPNSFNNYIEPFVGGGAVYWNINAKKYFINDISKDLILLYKYVKKQDKDFFYELGLINENWQKLKDIVSYNFRNLSKKYYSYKNGTYSNYKLKEQIEKFVNNIGHKLSEPLFTFNGFNIGIFKRQLNNNLFNKMIRIKNNELKYKRKLESSELRDNIECAIKSSYYMHFREIYNTLNSEHNVSLQRRVAIFLFIREYCFSSMFRFNSLGEFNVPYGGISYNEKDMNEKIEYYKNKIVVNKLRKTRIYRKDFIKFINRLKINSDDFMFLDPPYDTQFNEYDKNKFNKKDQIRLANYLKNECHCKFMLVIKNTSFIESLYKNSYFKIQHIDKNYSVNFRDRNKKNVEHLIITNY